jgi:uncharacterized protein YccT (UPF0319 family)
MNRLVSYLCNSVLLCSFITLNVSAAKLTITDNLVLRDIDDKAVEQSFLSTQQTVELTQGQHTLVIKYKDVFEDLDMGEERLVKSDYFVVKFQVENQQALFLSTIKINNLAQAERFVRSPELTLIDEHDNALILALEKLSDYELSKQVTKVVTTLSVPVVVTKNTNETTNIAKETQDFNQKVINEVDAVPMLKFWWHKASKNEQEDFLHFINENTKIKK